MLSPEQKEIREQHKLKREKDRFEIAYTEALKNPSLPEFKMKDNVIIIKRLSNTKFNNIKKLWKKEINKQIDEYTFERLCEEWNEPFCVGLRSYNPHDLIVQYFYHKHQIDLMDVKYQIIDKF